MKFRSIALLSCVILPTMGITVHAETPVLPTIEHPLEGFENLESDGVKVDVSAQFANKQFLIDELAEKHSYRLQPGELLKYIYDPQNEVRGKLYRFATGATPKDSIFKQPQMFEPFLLLFRSDNKYRLELSRFDSGVTTLGDILFGVFRLKPQECEISSGILNAYVPGDWVLSWKDPWTHVLSDAELSAFEKILNNQLQLSVKVAWKTVKRPTLVIRGQFDAAPQRNRAHRAGVGSQMYGTFVVPARRKTNGMGLGKYSSFIQAISDVVLLPVADESESVPSKEFFAWMYDGEPIMNSERLPAEQEARVIKSLHEQLGYDLTIEPREVKLLSIEPVEP